MPRRLSVMTSLWLLAAVGVAQDRPGSGRTTSGPAARRRAARRPARSRAGPSRAAAAGRSRGSARSSPRSRCRRSRRPRRRPARRRPSSVRRRRAPSASRSLAQLIGGEVGAARRAARRRRARRRRLSKLGRHDEPLVERDAGLGQAAPVAGQALARDEERLRPGEERDLSMAEAGQGARPWRRCRPRCRRRSRARRGRAARDGPRPTPLARMPARCRSSSSLSDGVVHAAAGEDHRRRAHRAQQPDVRVLALGVRLRAAGDDQVAARRGAVLHAAHDLGEVRVGDVVDDHADDRDVALEQPARERVGHVVERRARPRARARASPR